MRIYLVIMDESSEARAALHFASRRAQRSGGHVHILAIVPKQDFVAWGGVQATIEDEALARAEELVTSVAGALFAEMGQNPVITVRTGDASREIRGYLADHPDVAMLVLGAASSGAPGPLISHFAGNDAGALPCPLTIIPGGLSDTDIDRLT
ncbi:universal stress protein [Blastomonas sp.]|uniref:universal stress protein n=1 Tax=Blastomonas sp. TaxID=1909299 RepID=UPI0035936B1B